MRIIKKSQQYFHCEKCDYTTCNKYDFNKHLLTPKHKMDKKNRKKIAIPNTEQESEKNEAKFRCQCGKTYKYQSGLCKHKHKCPLLNNAFIAVDKPGVECGEKLVTTDMLNSALIQQKQLIQTIVDMSKERSVTNYYNNCNNKKMTINVFLNEECKDAMNFKDFIETLTVSLQDLAYTKEHGYAKGISNIFVNHLKDMDPTERPIHCSDKKRLQFYVKEDNKWEKDKDNKKIDKSINDVSKKQIKQLIEWQKQHPDYENNDKLLSEYFTMTRQVMGGGDISELINCGAEIKKTLSGEVEIKDAMLNKKDT